VEENNCGAMFSDFQYPISLAALTSLNYEALIFELWGIFCIFLHWSNFSAVIKFFYIFLNFGIKWIFCDCYRFWIFVIESFCIHWFFCILYNFSEFFEIFCIFMTFFLGTYFCRILCINPSNTYQAKKNQCSEMLPNKSGNPNVKPLSIFEDLLIAFTVSPFLSIKL
jgi:hypothetical protein